MIVNMNQLIGHHDLLFIVLDTLRYDVAKTAYENKLIPNMARYLTKGWEKRHSPATFTYPAHHAFFSGFLPTSVAPGNHPRLFSSAFIGSETIDDNTWCFKEATFVEALAKHQYHTLCVGGVGFFNKQNAIGSVFPDLFIESHWDETTSVANKHSTQSQVDIVLDSIARLDAQLRLFTFINISALHQPNYFYKAGAKEDSAESQLAALIYVDQQLERLFSALKERAPTFCIMCSDHGTCYGEGGYTGHKLAHDVVLTVPYAHFFLADSPASFAS